LARIFQCLTRRETDLNQAKEHFPARFFASSGPAFSKSTWRQRIRKNHESIHPFENNSCRLRVAGLVGHCHRTVLPQAKASAAEKGHKCLKGTSRSRSRFAMAAINKPTSGSGLYELRSRQPDVTHRRHRYARR